ncbi:ABC transporter substrate-binding protein [Streptomyces sp. bgisy029]|uniref:ABC transporter substrate-binding protein n=1 Tax=Streptomyces sp. bgisy029 TaxID=3413771 RepID=UPI003D75B140
MRSSRIWIPLLCTAVLAAGAGARLLLSEDGDRERPISVGTTDVVGSLDPAGSYDTGSWALYSNLYQSLLTLRPGSAAPVPDAAESCGFLDASLTAYACTLRAGLTFANGHPLTAQDVRFSFERMLGIATDIGPATLFAGLDSVSARGRTVTFGLRERDATFPLKLATGAGAIVDRSRYSGEALRPGTAVDGSGPYTLAAYTPGMRALLEPNPRYRGAVAVPRSAVEVRYFEDAEQLADAWRRGGVEVAHRQLPSDLTSTYDPGEESGRMTEAAAAEIRTVVFDLRPGSPLARREVRQAVAVLVDRGRITTRVHHSTVEPLYSLIPRGLTGHTTSFFDRYFRDDDATARARSLLRSAGVRTPVAFTYGHRSGAAFAAEAAELRRQLEATGLFRVRTVSAEWKRFQKGYASGAYDAYGLGWVPDFPDADNFTTPLVGRSNALHNTYASPRVDQLISLTQRHGDRRKASGVFREIQDEVAVDVPVLPLWQRKDYVLAAPDVAGSEHLSDGTGVWRLWRLNRM